MCERTFRDVVLLIYDKELIKINNPKYADYLPLLTWHSSDSIIPFHHHDIVGALLLGVNLRSLIWIKEQLYNRRRINWKTSK